MKFVLIVLTLVISLYGVPAHARGKVALIIANSAYQNVPVLRNPPKDAALVAASLKQAGFTSVEIAQNLDLAGLQSALRRFGERADGAEIAMVYFAGHGIEIGGRNYLVPVSARLLRDRDADLEALPLDSVLAVTEGARIRVILLDACRENPFAITMGRSTAGRSVARGLARVEPANDTLVVYAAKAGAIASDGDGGNSPFATSLARRLVEPGVELSFIFRRVRDDVLTATRRQQEPFVYGSLSAAEYYLTAPVAPVSAASTMPASVDAGKTEALIWQGALAANNALGFNDYLSRYPSGNYATQARANLARLNTAIAKPSTMPPRLPVGRNTPALVAKEYAQMIAGQCRSAITDRYPIFSRGQQQLSASDAQRLFGVGGAIDSFVANRLTPYIARATLSSRSGEVLIWNKLGPSNPFNPATPEELTKAERIRDVLANGLSMKISVVELGADVESAAISVAGTSHDLMPTTAPRPFLWTLNDQSRASVELRRSGAALVTVAFDGPWSLFRLIDTARLRYAGPNALEADFGTGTQSAKLRVEWSGTDRPFGAGGIWSFRCPTEL